MVVRFKAKLKPFLRELQLINVMSHKNSIFRFSNGINVLVGRRGSGKTTVIEALRLLFGGLGRERQAQLKGFVRYDANEAIIRGIFSNAVYIPGRGLIRLIPELPDDAEIVVERVIKKNGKSEFRLNGKIVRKTDIEKLFLRVNISPHNTLYFLPQERVNEWVTIPAKKRVDLLLSALGLYEVKERLQKLSEKIKEKRKLRNQLQRELNHLKKSLIEYEREISLSTALKDKLFKYYILKLAKIRKEIEDLTEKLVKLEDDERQIKTIYSALTNELQQREKKRKDIDLQLMTLGKKLTKIQNKRIEYDAKLKELEKKIDSIQSQLVELKMRMTEVSKKLEHIRKKWGIKTKEDLERLIEEKKEQKQQLQEKLFENPEYRKIYQLEEEKKRLKEEEEKLKREKQLLLKSIQDILKLLDQSGKLFELTMKLENLAYQDIHLANVYGPLALFIYVELPSDELREWALAIDKAIDDEVKKAFVALLPESREKLLDLANKVKATGINVITFGYKETDRLGLAEVLRLIDYIIERFENKREELKKKAQEIFGNDVERFIVGWVCDLIKAPSPIKALLELFYWDVPITTEEEYALKILRELKVSKVVTIDGKEFRRILIIPQKISSLQVSTPAAYEPERTIIFQVSVHSLYRYRETLEKIEADIRDLRNQVKKLSNQIRTLRSRLPARILELEEMLNNIERELQELYEAKYPFQKLLSDLHKLPTKEQKTRELLEKIQKEYENLIMERTKLDEEERLTRIKIRELEAKKEEILEKIGEIKLKLENLERRLEEIPPQIRLVKKMIEEKNKEAEQIKKRTLAIIELLKRYGKYSLDANTEKIFQEEIESKAEALSKELSVEQIDAELAILEKHLEEYTRALYNLESKLEEIGEIQRKIKEKEEELNAAEEELKKIEELSKKELQKLINEIKRKLSKANEYYQKLLSAINAHGSIILRGASLDTLSLQITIDLHREKPEDIDTGGFSSGEKTTAIIAFILSMFLASPSPIYMFDEFDIFLDDASLQEVLTIIRAALSKFQGIITTTHREEIIASANKVFYLEFDEKEKATRVYEIEMR